MGKVRAYHGKVAPRILRTARLSCLIAVFAAAPTAAEASNLTTSIDRIKKSIVGVATCQLTRRPPIALRGTGFAVADGRHIVTNLHVVDTKLNKENKEFLCLVHGNGRRPKIEPAHLVAKDEAHDVAILAFDGRQFQPVELGDERRVSDGHPIAFTGYPIGMVLGLYPVSHRGIVSARTPIAIPQFKPQGLDTKMVHRLRNLFEVFQLDATAYPGNSGSPLYDQRTGEVLGIVSSVFVKGFKENLLTNPSGITYAIPISHVRDLIRQAGLGTAQRGQIRRDTP